MSRIGWMSCAALMLGAVCFSESRAMAQPGGPGGPGGFGRHNPGPGPGAGYVDVSVFYESLAPYGEWIQMPPYGWVWMPYNTGYEWRPYTNGYWIWTECGWTWMSDEPFGWAVYHYGRWHFSPYNGWVWVPGAQWGPGWVAWRRGNGFVGWAPLPVSSTQSSINATFGNFSVELTQIRNHAWSFMEERYLSEENIGFRIARPSRNVSIIQNTNNITNYNIVNNTVINNSFRRQDLERRINRPIKQFRINDFDRPGNGGFQRDRDIVRFFRPKLNPVTKKTPDIIFNKDRRVTAPSDWKARQLADRQEADRKLAAERAALLDRQKREAARVGKLGISPDELKRRQEQEKRALEEQEARTRKLVDRHYDRLQKGQGGYTEGKNTRRFDKR